MAFKKTNVMKVMKAKGVISAKAERSTQLERSLKREVSAKGDKMMKSEGMKVKRGRGRPRKVQMVEVGVKRKIKAEVATKPEVGLKGVKRKGKVPIVAKGRLSRFLVFSGRRMRTVGGLRKENIGINKRGRYVSLKQAAHGSKMYNANIKGWNVAFRSARTQLNCKGFVAINGKSLLGQALYVRMKKLQVKDTKAQNKAEVKEEKVVTLVENLDHI